MWRFAALCCVGGRSNQRKLYILCGVQPRYPMQSLPFIIKHRLLPQVHKVPCGRWLPLFPELQNHTMAFACSVLQPRAAMAPFLAHRAFGGKGPGRGYKWLLYGDDVSLLVSVSVPVSALASLERLPSRHGAADPKNVTSCMHVLNPHLQLSLLWS